MKKILYIITQSELGGAQRYVWDLARGFKDDYEVAVAFGEPYESGELAKMLDNSGIKYHTLPHLKRAISPLSDLRALIGIIRLIKKIKPDIVHLNSSKVSILGSLAAFLCNLKPETYNLKTIYTVHGWVFNEPMAKWRELFYRYAEKFTAGWKDKIICISEADYGTAADELKIPAEKLVLVHHGLDLTQYNFLPRDEARARLEDLLAVDNLNHDSILIGCIGNLYPTKGYEYFIRAMEHLIFEFKLPVIAIIIGEGPERAELEGMIKEVHLAVHRGKAEIVRNKIILAGRIVNAAELLPAFDFYVATSVKEGFPYTILEAMAAGLPVVSTEVGGIGEIIEDGINGSLVEPKKDRVVAKKIYELVNNPSIRQKIAARAKHEVELRFKYQKMLEKTRKAYE